MTEEVVKVDYDAMSMDQLLEAMGKAYKDKEMKLMGALSKLYTKAEAGEEKAKKDALQEVLQTTTADTLKEFTSLSNKLIEAGKLDGAEVIYFAYDLGEKLEKGINPSLKLIKSGRKASTGVSAGQSSYVANPAKSTDLLEQVGGHIMFKEDEEITIDKVKQVMKAGTTFEEAYKHSTNGGWRNRVRMALLKEAGLV